MATLRVFYKKSKQGKHKKGEKINPDDLTSPFWYVKYRDLDSGKWKTKNTKLRVDDPKQCRAAERLKDKYSASEANVAPTRGENFIAWVPAFLKSNYPNLHSRQRYGHVWFHITQWLKEQKFQHPAEIKYVHFEDYMDWRKAAGAKHNTARLEAKFFSTVLGSAMKRGYIPANPFVGTRIAKEPAREKNALEDAQIRACQEAFKNEAWWMSVVFNICVTIGCRFNEARIEKKNINFDDLSIVVTDSKRKPTDRKRTYKIPIWEGFAKYLKKLPWKGEPEGDSNVTKYFTVPPLTGEMNQRFNKVMKKACGETSHSCRVTFITRCHKAEVSLIDAMALVNHSQSLVHMIYSKLDLKHSRAAHAKLTPPPPPLPSRRKTLRQKKKKPGGVVITNRSRTARAKATPLPPPQQ